MSLAGSYDKFRAQSRLLGDEETMRGLDRLRLVYERLEDFQRVIDEVHARTARRMTPNVRAMLLESYSAARIGTHTPQEKKKYYKGYRSGELKAAVSAAVVEVTKRGIRIAMPRGLSEKLYSIAGALNYGAVRGPVEVREVRDTVTGAVNSVERRSVLGSRAKRTIKRAFLTGKGLSKRARASLEGGINGRNVKRRGVSSGEITVIPPREFFVLSPSQLNKLAEDYAKVFSEELNRTLGANMARKGA